MASAILIVCHIPRLIPVGPNGKKQQTHKKKRDTQRPKGWLPPPAAPKAAKV